MVGKRLLLLLLLLATAFASLWLFQSAGNEQIAWQDPALSLPKGSSEVLQFPEPGVCVSKLKQQNAYQDLFGDLDILTQWVESARDSVAQSWIHERPILRASYGDSSVYIYGTPENTSRQELETWMVSHLEAQPLKSGVLSLKGAQELFVFLGEKGAYLTRSNSFQIPAIASEEETALWLNRLHMGSRSDILQIRENETAAIPFIRTATKGLMVRDIQLESQSIAAEEYMVQERSSIEGAALPSHWTQYLPSDATNIEGLGVPSGAELIKEHTTNLGKRNLLAAYNDSLAEIESISGISVDAALGDWWNTGVLLFESNEHHYALLGSVSSGSARSSFEQDSGNSSTALNGGNLFSWDSTTVVSFAVQAITGKRFQSCWIKDNEVLLGNTREAIVELVARLRSDDKMDDNHIVHQALQRGEQFVRYTSFEQTNTSAIEGMAVPVFDTEEGPFSHLVQSGIHLGSGKWVTRVDISPATRKTAKVALAWQKRLGYQIVGKVGSVKNHRNGEYYLLIQDSGFKLHAVDARGKAMWRYQLESEVNSEFFSIDLYRNEKYQIAFSTKSKVHCLDLNGRNVTGFPIAPKEEITMPLYVADYDATRNYRFLFGLSDGQILNYRDEGQATSGWKYKGKTPAVYGQHLKSRDKDYLFIALEDGRVQLLKRNGKVRHKTGLQLPSVSPPFYFKMASDISRSAILLLDSNTVTELSFGNGSKPEINILGEAEDFMLADLNNDRQDELILCQGSEVIAYNADGNQLFKRIMDGSIQKGIKAYRFNSGQKPGLVVEDRNELYLLEGSGNSASGFPLFGATLPVIRDFDADGVMELITTDGEGLLLCYEL